MLENRNIHYIMEKSEPGGSKNKSQNEPTQKDDPGKYACRTQYCKTTDMLDQESWDAHVCDATS